MDLKHVVSRQFTQRTVSVALTRMIVAAQALHGEVLGKEPMQFREHLCRPGRQTLTRTASISFQSSHPKTTGSLP